MWARLEERTPELIEETRLQRETAERLFAELMQTPPGRRLGVIRQSRFRSLDLLDLLLEVSHARQLADRACAAGEAVDTTTVNLRRMFRNCGLRLKPLPFA